MRAVTMARYGGPEVLEVQSDVPPPEIGHEDVLVRVHASSVNPIDTRRRAGYGRALFERRGARLPLIPGRDLSGTVERVGPRASRFLAGAEVWGAQEVSRQGTYAELVAIRQNHLDHKPKALSHTEAATIPYVAETVFAALSGTAAATPETLEGKKVLVHAGSGGIGSFAIQLFVAWGAEVATTCSTRNVALCDSLGAHTVIDYTQADYSRELGDLDLVLDTLGVRAGEEERSLSVLRRGGEYVSLVHPLMSLIDRLGLPIGGAAAALTLAGRKLRQRLAGRSYKWGLFAPEGEALAVVRELVDAGRIRAVVEKIFSLAEVADAHRHVETGRTRGKVGLRIADGV